MIDSSRLALNRIACPWADLEEFFRLTRSMGLKKVELRNDLPGRGITDGLAPEKVRDLMESYGIRVLAINALPQFDLVERLADREAELRELIGTARSIGCPAILMCPNNDPKDDRSEAVRHREALQALNRYGPLFEEAGLLGYLEALGFASSSLRSLVTAGALIEECPYPVYRAVFDTFHHQLGPDTLESLRAGYDFGKTGLVHVSGVYEDFPAEALLDEHRGLLRDGDRLGSLEQLELLERSGYRGEISFEPFSPAVQKLDAEALVRAVGESIAAVKRRLG